MPSMFARSFMAALLFVSAVLCIPASARADATYEFSLLGQMTEAGQSWTWTGTLTIVLDSGADGLYDSDHFLAFDMDSSTGPSFHLSDPSFIPFIVYANVEDGRLTSIGGRHYGWPYPEETTDFGGMSVHYYHPLIIKTPETIGDAVLSPVAVPEPGAGPMLLLGLGLAAAAGGLGRQARAAHRTASH